jgi:hypothetical protein
MRNQTEAMIDLIELNPTLTKLVYQQVEKMTQQRADKSRPHPSNLGSWLEEQILMDAVPNKAKTTEFGEMQLMFLAAAAKFFANLVNWDVVAWHFICAIDFVPEELEETQS